MSCFLTHSVFVVSVCVMQRTICWSKVFLIP